MKRKAILPIFFGLLVAALPVVAFPVHAEEIAVHHEKMTTETEAEDTWYAVARGVYLSGGTGKVKQAGVGKVCISGRTLGTGICDTLKLALYLDESSDNKSYGTIGTYHYSSKNDLYVSGYEAGIRVTSGYYYSLRGVHSVTHNGKTETTDSSTDAIVAL